MMRKINTFLIGAQKAGTTSYYDWLIQHPMIYGQNKFKDVHLFAKDKLYNNLDNELAIFFNTYQEEKIVFHGAVNYMYFEQSAKRIYNYNPDAKIIVVLRNPVQRAFSAYTYFKKLRKEKRSFEEALRFELENTYDTFGQKADLTYIQHGYYYKQLKPYFDLFSAEQIHVQIQEEVLINKEGATRDMFSFLNIDTDFKVNYTHKNITGSNKIEGINALLYDKKTLYAIVKKVLKAIVPIEKRVAFKNWIIRKNTSKTEKEVISEDARRLLHNIYMTEIAKLEYLLNKSLSIWQ